MDTLSQFLSLHAVATRLDWRCELQAPWRLVNEGIASGTIPYHLVIEGNSHLDVVGKEQLMLQPGDAVMLPHGSPHILHCGDHLAPLPEMLPPQATTLGTLKAHGQGRQTEILCGEFILDPHASRLLVQALPDVVVLRTQNNKMHWHLHQLLHILNQETQEAAPGARIIAEHLATALFSLMVRGWITETDSSGNILGLIAEPRLNPAIQILLTEPARVRSLEELARLCHMSRATFIRLCKQTGGQPPAQLFTSIRLAHAAKLLSKRGISIGAICEKIGYSSEPAFHRVFRQKMGVSPGEFRRQQLLKLAG